MSNLDTVHVRRPVLKAARMSLAANRRQFLTRTAAVAGVAAFGFAARPAAAKPAPQTGQEHVENPHDRAGGPPFKISLAQWSLHKMLFEGKLSNPDFPKYAKQECGIEAVEWVNQFFKDKAKDNGYLTDLKQRCEDQGVKSLLIMCDGEGALGDADDAKRKQAVENHYKWVEAAEFLGCHSIRVNAQSSGSFTEQLERAADGLRRLCEFADPHGINVIVENHGGLSSNGAWLAAVMEQTNNKRVGTLPDFGNFHEYDRYKGVMQTIPYAKGVSAKSHDFDDKGEETHTNYHRMLGIVTGWGYNGYVGIEYEGSKIGEKEGIMATKQLLERVREEMASVAPHQHS